ncbi:MAG: hypothetical protein WBD79_17040 [Anaerolineae bacterium]
MMDMSASDLSPEVLERVDQARAAREAVRAEDPQFFAAISTMIFKADPIGINFTINTDEYDPEAGTVIPRLSACQTADDVTAVLYEEFTKWFEAEIAGKRADYVELAQNLWTLSQERAANRPDTQSSR